MSVAAEETPSRAPAGAIGWIGGFGTKWQDNPAKNLTTILLTQRVFDSPKPAAILEQDAKRLAG